MKLLHFTDLQCYSGVECCIVLYNDKSCSRGMYTGIEGRGRRAYGRVYSSLFYDVRTHGVQ